MGALLLASMLALGVDYSAFGGEGYDPFGGANNCHCPQNCKCPGSYGGVCDCGEQRHWQACSSGCCCGCNEGKACDCGTAKTKTKAKGRSNVQVFAPVPSSPVTIGDTVSAAPVEKGCCGGSSRRTGPLRRLFRGGLFGRDQPPPVQQVTYQAVLAQPVTYQSVRYSSPPPVRSAPAPVQMVCSGGVCRVVPSNGIPRRR